MKRFVAVGLLAFLPACSLAPSSLPATPPLQARAKVPRPFYLIGHNPNTAELARAFIDAGANAIEPDLRYVDGEIRVHDQFVVLGLTFRYPFFDGPGPTLSEYLQGLDEKRISPALIAWDLKPPFELPWMRDALDLIRREYGAKHPHTAMLFTVGSRSGLPALKLFAPLLRENEAVGIDDFTPPALAQTELGGTGKPHTYADRRRKKEIAEAVAMRDAGKSFALVYAWTVNDVDELERFLRIGVDGVITDLHALPELRKYLQSEANHARFRLAEPSHKPF